MGVQKTQCSFCDRWAEEVPYMVEASPHTNICSLCIEEYSNPPTESLVSSDESLSCSFCGKPAHAVEQLMQGFSDAAICKVCVGIARAMMEENSLE